MPVVNKNLTGSVMHGLLQTLAGSAVIGLLMLGNETLLSLPIIASLAATMFILVTSPHSPASRPRNLVGGYLCGMIGAVIARLPEAFATGLPEPLNPVSTLVLTTTLAVAITALLMVIFDLNHPPACALAFFLVTAQSPPVEYLLTFVFILLMSAALQILRPFMKDLFVEKPVTNQPDSTP